MFFFQQMSDFEFKRTFRFSKEAVTSRLAAWRGCDLACTGPGRGSGGGGARVERGSCVVGIGAGVRVEGAEVRV